MTKKSKRYESPEHRIAICGVAHQERFHDRFELAAALEQFWSDASFQVRGQIRFRGDKSYVHELPPTGVVELISDETNRSVRLLLDRAEFQVMRMPKRLLGDYWDVNVQVRLWLPEQESLDSGIEVLKAMTLRLGLFWGEVNDEQITEDPSYCGLNEHSLFVPGFGTANYFGQEYFRYFGGLKRFRAAPDLIVEEFAEGVLTRIADCRDHTGFCEKRDKIHQHLGKGLFDTHNKPVKPLYRQLFWPHEPYDRAAANALFEAIVRVGKPSE